MKLYIVRHAQSEYNEQERFTGIKDVKLNEKGIEQSLKCGKEISNIKFDVCFTSKLLRSQETCELILNENLYPPGKKISLEFLNEKDDGILTNQKFSDARKFYGDETVDRWFFGIYEGPPKGESYNDCFQRVKQCFDTCIKPVIMNHRRSNLLLVAHQGSIACLRVYLENDKIENVENYKMKNVEYRIYEI